MADSAYDSSLSHSQSHHEAGARLDPEFDRLDRALQSAQSAAAELRDLGKSLIFKTRSESAETLDRDERLDMFDTVDRLDELTHFVQCACLGVEALGSPRERDGLEAVLSHAIFWLKGLSNALRPELPAA